MFKLGQGLDTVIFAAHLLNIDINAKLPELMASEESANAPQVFAWMVALRDHPQGGVEFCVSVITEACDVFGFHPRDGIEQFIIDLPTAQNVVREAQDASDALVESTLQLMNDPPL